MAAHAGADDRILVRNANLVGHAILHAAHKHHVPEGVHLRTPVDKIR